MISKEKISKSSKERVKLMSNEIKAGFNFLTSFKHDRVVTIFGSAQTPAKDPVYQQARTLGRLLAEDGITVVTGGGPGLMEAANRGAYEAGGRSVGLNIFIEDIERRNPYLNESIAFNYFFARKLILAHIAQAYVYFPGGFGTLDEFFEISTLVGTKKIENNIPIVLISDQYYQDLKKFLETQALRRYKALTQEKLKIWQITDNVEEAFEIVRKIPKVVRRHESV